MNQAKNPTARECLPCTACCDGWLSGTIRGHDMSAGQPCHFRREDGCSIYSERPQSPCRQFFCSWIVDDSPLPDWMRPDRCGAVVLLSLPWQGEKVISAVPAGSEIPEKTLNWLMGYAQQHRRPLIWYERERDEKGFTDLRARGFGPPAFREKVAAFQAAGESPFQAARSMR